MVGAPLTTLKLYDNGNAALINNASGRILWQSFDNPTDTFLPGMIMGTDMKLTSWKSETDPGSGSYQFQPDDGWDSSRLCYILNKPTTYHWKSGKISKDSFYGSQVYSKAINLLTNATKKGLNKSSQYGKLSFDNISAVDTKSRLVMAHSGKLQYFSWAEAPPQWNLEWEEPKDACSIYKVCGPFGICIRDNEKPLCRCLPGFEMVSPDNPTSGCKRTSQICDGNETFINRTLISMDNPTLPFEKSNDESECINRCLQNCSCLAYSYSSQNNGTQDPSRVSTQGCWFWETEPYNLREMGTRNISFRVSNSLKEKSNTERKSSFPKRVLVISMVGSALVLSLFCAFNYIIYKRLATRRNSTQNNIEFQSRTHINELLHLEHSKEDEREGLNVPYFELQSIIYATDDFSEENRLGEGGFGPVYKGKLPGGEEIAVKRLSSLSGQGLQEFKNEVTVIAKLQHKNLVRLLGYCIRGEEKLLLYEYMPNRSLDHFIFDHTLCASLDWQMRFNIIMGIARGLNYLHHDSRLRIIHRDLKTSNILLDEDMNPKISDFGLAKIIKGKDIEDITNRVVGTFGYMSPEYVLDGLFSIKSDVFSFGVVLLEIVSGKRNTGFYQSKKRISLLGHAWSLWIEDRPFDLLDQVLTKSCNLSEVLKCISVGLMCVQGDPDDRPTMTSVVMMLGGDMATLPNPKEPVFIPRRDHVISSSSSSSKQDSQTKNMLTITEVVGR